MIFGGLYLFIFLTPFLAWRLKKYVQPYFLKILVSTCIALMFALLAKFIGITFISTTANAFFIYLMYFFFGICAFQLYSKNQNKISKTLSVLAPIPFLVTPVLSIPAILAVAFIAGDLDVEYETTSNEGYLCQVTPYGNATTSINGYEAIIYKTILFLKFEKSKVNLENTYKPEVTPEYACRVALNKLQS